jgi:hypothetical protein
VMLGTPDYISPEQLRAPQDITPKTDQYSLGVVMYEAATGRNPFVGHASLMSILRAIEVGDYPLPSELNQTIDENIERVALRAMSISPGARFSSMAALGAELLPLAGHQTRNAWARYFAAQTEAGAIANPSPGGVRITRQRAFWAGSAALLLVAGFSATVLLGTGSAESNSVGTPVPLASAQQAPSSPVVTFRQSVLPASAAGAPADLSHAAPTAEVERRAEARAPAAAEPVAIDEPSVDAPLVDKSKDGARLDMAQRDGERRAAKTSAPLPRKVPSPPRSTASEVRPEIRRGPSDESLDTDNIDPWDP